MFIEIFNPFYKKYIISEKNKNQKKKLNKKIK